MPTANRSQRIAALRKAGWPETLIPTAVAVSLTEFGPQRDLITQSQSDVVSNGKREDSWGPWQIHLPSHREVTKSCAMDLDCSTAAALHIYERRGNFSAWSVFNSGAYLQNFIQDGSGTVDGTAPTVSQQHIGNVPGSPDYKPFVPTTTGNTTTGTFPSFNFPHFDIIKPAHVKWPGGGIDFAGVGFNTGIVFKLGVTVAVFVMVFLGVFKLSGISQETKKVAEGKAVAR